MPLWEWQAPRALAPWVAGFAASADRGRPEPVRVLPDGGADLLFSAPAAGGDWRAEVFGPKTSALVVCDREQMDKIAVRLRPGAAARWLGVPAHALADQALPLDLLWGGSARELAARLAETRGLAAQRACIEAALLTRAVRIALPSPLVEAAVSHVVASGGRIGTRALARELGASERCLERVFAEHVGLRPKLLGRIVRLGEARRALARGTSQLEAALGAGYHDQAHLHRDCRALAGCPPSVLVGFVQAPSPPPS